MSQFALRPVAASPTLGQQAYDAIAGLIDTGQVKPGQRLVESDLATALGVSRGPVREALHLLSKEGWVDIRPRLGAFVDEATLKKLNTNGEIDLQLNLSGIPQFQAPFNHPSDVHVAANGEIWVSDGLGRKK